MQKKIMMRHDCLNQIDARQDCARVDIFCGLGKSFFRTL